MDEENIVLLHKDEFREKSRKRRFSLCEQTNVIDSTNNDDDENIENGAPENKFRLIAAPFRLLDFSDEVLFEIFKYLDSWTLMALMNCCSRLSSLILDHRFWNYIDLSKEPLPLGILEDVLERSQVNTTCIKLHGPPVAQHLEREGKQFSQTLAKVFEECCINLSVLELRGITIDFRFVRITDFPCNLKRLLLNDCNVRFEGEKSIFLGIDTHLTKLEELAIENSNWFEPYYMMVFSKVPELRALSLKGCQLLSDFVPYGSMAARFGFKKLEYLDLRFTPISDSDLQCFNAVATLKEVLLDCPESLRENNTENIQDSKMKIRNCYCHSRPSAETTNGNSSSTNNESPTTSNASRLRITVSVSQANENGPSTSAAAAQQSQSHNSQSQSSTSQSSSQENSAREEDSSFSSCSSSPSASSSSSNESLPPLLGSGNPPPRAPQQQQNPLELPLPGSNAPPFSRFLPRPDQIILLDLNNRWRRVVMQNVPVNRGENDVNADERLREQEIPPPEAQEQQQAPEVRQPDQQQQPPQPQANNQDNNVHQREFRVFLHHQQQLQHRLFDAERNALGAALINNNHVNNININNNNHNNNNHMINHINNVDNNNGNGNINNANQIEQVLSHPLFWDMINPFARERVGRIGIGARGGRISGGQNDDGGAGAGGEHADGAADFRRRFECRRSQCSGQYHQYHRHRHRSHHHPISDRGICCFGRPRNPVEHGIIWIRIGNRPSENRFERLSIRNYKLVTDVSLQHLVQCSPYLVYLDLSGTGVTQRGIDTFKERKPQCVIVADHLMNHDAPNSKQNCEGDCSNAEEATAPTI